MITLKTEDEIELLRAANLLVGKTLAEIAKVIAPGVTTRQLDTLAETFIRDNGAVATFKGFPNPFCVGEVSDEVRQLLKITKESLYLGIDAAKVGHRLGDIGYSVQHHCEENGYGVVREFVGHGIGREMHEDPMVPNYGHRGNGIMLKNGLCIAIEPMITMGSRDIMMMPDRWAIKTRDGKPAAHFEHTIAIHHGKADIMSSFEDVEKIEQQRLNK